MRALAAAPNDLETLRRLAERRRQTPSAALHEVLLRIAGRVPGDLDALYEATELARDLPLEAGERGPPRSACSTKRDACCSGGERPAGARTPEAAALLAVETLAAGRLATGRSEDARRAVAVNLEGATLALPAAADSCARTRPPSPRSGWRTGRWPSKFAGLSSTKPPKTSMRRRRCRCCTPPRIGCLISASCGANSSNARRTPSDDWPCGWTSSVWPPCLEARGRSPGAFARESGREARARRSPSTPSRSCSGPSAVMPSCATCSKSQAARLRKSRRRGSRRSALDADGTAG